MEESADPSSAQSAYTVVARRYRPKSFEQLIGQEHVAQALGKAIATGRVGHAYLFTGARGVGKTSTARIFAKALNLHEGMSEDLATEITSAIDSGDDIDVIEIDGASNRGISEIRQLRANVNVRPSRAKYKIYIIDEVHMLTKEAFNALLKTLEEPPPHVKFIFCTTDPEKIPITVLSRCQRFDFAPVKFEAIVGRLQEIATNEGFECEPEALGLLARRAAGSMRDSQSLLEQVMSFSSGKITAEQVHSLLGIADESLLLRIVEALYQQNALEAIAAADDAMSGGADAGQLSEQLLNYLRDIMAVGIGGTTQLLKFASPMNHAKLQELAKAWGIQTILSAIQILDESIVRMRSSVSAATLLEVAMVQICQLQQLASIPALIAALGTDAAQKKKPNQPLGSISRVDAPHATAVVAAQSSPAQSAPAHNTLDHSDIRAELNPNRENTDSSAPQFTSLSDALRQQKNSVNSSLPGAEASPQAEAGARLAASSPTMPGQSLQRIDGSLQPLAGSHLPPLAGGATSSVAITGSAPDSSEPNRAGTAVSGAQQSGAASSALGRTDGAHSGTKVDGQASVAQSVTVNSSEPAIQASGDAMSQWKRALGRIEGLLADYCSMVVAVEPRDSTTWRVVFPPGAMMPRDYCEQAARKSQIVTALAQTLGRTVVLQFDIQPGQAPGPSAVPVNNAAERTKRMRDLANHPLIKKIVEVLDGEIVKVIPPAQRPPAPNAKPTAGNGAAKTHS